tara:strand:+ start:456 stop:806 length:351 start_codon:yes stop_codon:yes gene_type:complete
MNSLTLPNILFKITSNDPKNKSLTVKCCRETALKPIDDYKEYNISYRNLDFSSPQSFEDSMRTNVSSIVLTQLINEPVLPENVGVPEILSDDINDYVDKVICTTYNTSSELNRIEL